MVVRRAKLGLELSAADQKYISAAGLARGQKCMTLFATKVREINDRGWIVGRYSDDRTGRQRPQPFCSLKNGQRTQKSGRVQFIVDLHERSAMRDVTICPPSCESPCCDQMFLVPYVGAKEIEHVRN
jgi:hypothetical protein